MGRQMYCVSFHERIDKVLELHKELFKKELEWKAVCEHIATDISYPYAITLQSITDDVETALKGIYDEPAISIIISQIEKRIGFYVDYDRRLLKNLTLRALVNLYYWSTHGDTLIHR